MSGFSSVEDILDQCKDLFIQDGVLLQSCKGRPVSELNSIGMLCFVQNQDGSKYIEWRPNDLITIDSDIQDQEWTVVDTMGRRQRTLSGNITSDYAMARARSIKIPLDELETFKSTRNHQQIQFSTKHGTSQSSFFFQHGNAEIFMAYLKNHIKIAKRDRNTYIVVEPNNESQVLNRSFAELDIFQENTADMVSSFVSNFWQNPRSTTLGAFSKFPYNIANYGNEALSSKRDVQEELTDLTKSSSEGNTTGIKNDEYEVVSMKNTLPARPNIPRGTPLSTEKWEGLQDTEGRVTEVEGVRQLIFRGGVAHSIRQFVWKYLLDYYPWHMSHAELKILRKKKKEEYYCMKLQWRSMTEGQESRFSDYRDHKSLVEKDVNRTDRTHPFFAGDHNPNLIVLHDILMTYVMYNFDLGYVQGMSDILAPLLMLLGNEEDTFWCFVGFMEKVSLNFQVETPVCRHTEPRDMDQGMLGMKHQLLQLQQLLMFVSPELANHLAQKESGNMYFCFRWLLVWFKREFSHIDIMRLWEVLWTGLPCANFHLLICVAILDGEKDVITSKDYGFTEILKHVNELSMCLDVDKILCAAEGIYHQIISAPHLTNQIRVTLGMPTLGSSTHSTRSNEEPTTSTEKENGRSETSTGFGPDMEEVMYQIGLDMNF